MKIEKCPVCCNDEFKTLDYIKNPKQESWDYDCFKSKKLSECLECKFIFTSEVFKKGSLSKFYNSIYKDNILEDFKPSHHYEFSARSFSHVNFIKNNVDLVDDLSILEIGPNQNGMIPSFRLFCDANYYYFEQFEFPVIKHYGGKKLGEYFNKDAAVSLDKKMDLIVLSHSFEHFEPSLLNESVEAMKYGLADNGFVSIEVPLESESELTAPHTAFFNVNNLSLLLEKHGFEIVSTQCIKGNDTKFSKINNTIKTASGSKKLLKFLLSMSVFRKTILRIIMPYYNDKLKALYDGRSYIRVLVKK